MEQLDLENEYGWHHRYQLPENTYESEKDRLVREIGYIENYLEALKAKLHELTGE